RAPGQDRRGAVDRGVDEPALARGDEPTGDVDAPAGGHGAEGPGPVAEGIVEALAVERGVEERREERPRLHLARADELGYGEHLRGAAVERRGGDDRVRRPEVDPDGETRGHGPFASTEAPGSLAS